MTVAGRLLVLRDALDTTAAGILAAAVLSYLKPDSLESRPGGRVTA
jgi:hypothetical protein